MQAGSKHYEVIIFGGGVVGSATLYALSNFSDVKSALLIEKEDMPAMGASNSRSNSQTLHVGDIETNYTFKKALETKAAADMVVHYASMLPARERSGMISRVSKTVIGVDDEEIGILEKRYDSQFLRAFPHIKRLERKDLAEKEPHVVRGRNKGDSILAMHSEDGYMVNYGKLTKSFIDKSRHGHAGEVHFGEKVLDVKEHMGKFWVRTTSGNYTADFVVFALGSYSLYFAKKLGYAEDLSILPVGGRFYYSRRVTNGKVYRVQKGSVPFAAVHGDADIDHPNWTRFGPTVDVAPLMERGSWSTFFDYLYTFGLDPDSIGSALRIAASPDISKIFLENLAYNLPVVGRRLFLDNEVRKIIPMMTYEGLRPETGSGGIRPQLVDKRRRKLLFGILDIEAEGAAFDISPSPGATSCLREALDDALTATRHLGRRFETDRFCGLFCKDKASRRLLFESLRNAEKY